VDPSNWGFSDTNEFDASKMEVITKMDKKVATAQTYIVRWSVSQDIIKKNVTYQFSILFNALN
jgi:hypothetical protein